MATNNGNQRGVENAISAARTAVVFIQDELLPDAAARGIGFELHDSIEDELRKTVDRLDEASDALQEFGFEWHRVEDACTELEYEVAELRERADATEFHLLADSLLHELRGRTITDEPGSIVRWMERALVTVLDSPTPDDANNAHSLLMAAAWRNG